MRLHSPPTFAQRLILYGLSIAIPVLVMCGLLVYHYTVERYREIEGETLAIAHELAKDLDREIQSLQLLLETLSGVLGPEMDLARLHRNAMEALVPRGSHVIVHDMDGWQILNTTAPFGTSLPVNYDPEHIKTIISKNETHVSDLNSELLQGHAAWMVSAPIRRHDGSVGLIGIVRTPDNLAEALSKRSRPPEVRWYVSDRKSLILASSSTELLGNKLPQRYLRTDAQVGVGWVESLEGEPMVRSFVRSQASDWRVAVAVPAAVVEAPLREAWLLFGLGSAVLLALALALASTIARRLHDNVDVLVASAEKLGRGAPLPEHNYATREFQHIHDALVSAAAERHRNEERRHLLLRELQHRTNNLLAVISSIVRRTLLEGRSMTEARDVLLGRLQALANASDTLAAAHWQGADMALVIENEMRPFAGRYTAKGPRMLLSAQAAQSASLVIHELATNASKHGALSQPDGNVAISWAVESRAEEPRLRFEWKESGGPSAKPPTRQGFGYTLLQTVLSDADLKPEIRFETEGLHYRATVRLATVQANGAPIPQSNGAKSQPFTGSPS